MCLVCLLFSEGRTQVPDQGGMVDGSSVGLYEGVNSLLANREDQLTWGAGV